MGINGGLMGMKKWINGGDWNHGILNDFPFSWESHHPN